MGSQLKKETEIIPVSQSVAGQHVKLVEQRSGLCAQLHLV
jgi:hypothetical protein